MLFLSFLTVRYFILENFFVYFIVNYYYMKIFIQNNHFKIFIIAFIFEKYKSDN